MKIIYTVFLLCVVGVFSTSCPSGYHLVRDSLCVGVKLEKVNRFAAYRNCENDGGRLLQSFLDDYNNIKQDVLSLLPNETGWFWIGVSCYASNNCYKDGDSKSPLSSYYFNPQFHQKNGPLLILSSTGVMSSAKQLDVMDGYICELSLEGMCSDGFLPSQDSCFLAIKSAMTSESAEEFCQTKDAHLASITSKNENDFISELLSEFTEFPSKFVAHIGLKNNENGTKIWRDGSLIAYLKTRDAYKNLGDCVGFIFKSKGNNLDGPFEMTMLQDFNEWTFVNCEQKLPFVCSKPKLSSHKPVSSQENDIFFPFSCPKLYEINNAKEGQIEHPAYQSTGICEAVIIAPPEKKLILSITSINCTNGPYVTIQDGIMFSKSVMRYFPWGGINPNFTSTTNSVLLRIDRISYQLSCLWVIKYSSIV